MFFFVLQVALGGAIGASLRFLAMEVSIRNFGLEFPYGTLFVNVLGSFVMGLLAVFLFSHLSDEKYAPFLLSGVLGGFTTFSAFSLDALTLIEKGRLMTATAYMAGSVGLSILAVVAGVFLMRWMIS